MMAKSNLCRKREESIQNPTVLPWDRFSRWIHCICVVTFDLELGQAMEIVFPSHVKLSEQEKSNICYLAFPDSNSGCIGDTQFHFRIRQSSSQQELNKSHLLYNRKCPLYLQTDVGYYFGYVYFRQVRDKALPRGYFQKSVVLLSKLPLITLFLEVVSLIAPEFFKNGDPSIEAACHDMDHWPDPIPGETLNLPLLGTIIQIQIPSQINKANSTLSNCSPNVLKNFSQPLCTIFSSVYNIPFFQCFSTVISHIHLLWELVLTAEPIVVMAGSPTTCSQLVQALVSMISPLMYCGDFRPYFTIHDSEFKEYTTKAHAPPPVILGVTNPFFAKTFQHWPHILCIYEANNVATLQKHKLKKTGNIKVLDLKPGVYTQYKPFLHKDKDIQKKLIKGVEMKRPREVQSALLRRHLLELTQSFIIPLERYMASLMPLQKNISPYKAAPNLKTFNPEEFLATLDSSGPQLTSGVKGDWVGLYKRFFRSSNFNGWFNARYQEVSQKLKTLQLEALNYSDLNLWVHNKEEVEIVDIILTIQSHLNKSETGEVPLSSAIRESLETKISDIICTLPDDLKSILKCNT